MANEDIRKALQESQIKHWQLADLLKVSETTLVRKLRKELSSKEKEENLKIIKLEKERRN